ncbi:MAG: aminoglycoside phosphotransferase family protein [Solirubrobacterales bacterium]
MSASPEADGTICQARDDKASRRSVDPPGIDPRAVGEWIAARVPGLAPPLRFTAVGNGRSNLTYLAEDERGGAVVVRRPPLGDALESAHDVGREFRVLEAPNNLLMTAAGEVAAILDWELWTLGDPIADLAWFSIWWPPDVSRSPLGFEPPSLAAGAPSLAELTATYAERSGRDLDRLGFWTALSYWKLAIIIEGVYRRWLEDPANGGAEAGELRPRADAMAELALTTLEET